MLFNLVLFLYNLVSQNKFKEIEIDSLDLNLYLSEEKIILKILEYTESVVNHLLKQKKFYYSNNKLKELYENISKNNEKNKRKEKIFMKIKIKEYKDIEKSEKIKEKMNKKYFILNRKIDYDYFRKEMNKKKKVLDGKDEKPEIKFEDFLYDIYQ